MISKTILFAALLAYAEARFGQEQVPIPAINSLQAGAPGVAPTIAGAAVSDILAAANACAKLSRADQVISELGTSADVISAAIGLVTAEKNTNPFVNNNIQNVCDDPTLPASQQLRGITPLIDPAVDVNGAVAALSKQTAASPLDATGKSVFDLLVAAGLGDLVQGQAVDGTVSNSSSSTGGAQPAASAAVTSAAASAATSAAAVADEGEDCDVGASSVASASVAAASVAAASAAPVASATAAASSGNATIGASGASTIAGADFGKCTPTIIFEGGLGGRPATEFTFQIADPFCRGGQQEALNPNIITNALCNQLTNVCEANDAAKAACLDGKAKVAALGTRDKNTADVFNAAVGFAGAVTNPDGGPANPAASAAAAGRRSMQFRA